MNLSPHWRGHLLRFDARPEAPPIDPRAALRLMLVVVLLEGLIGPRFEILKILGLHDPPAALRMAILIPAALLLVRFFARVSFRQVGFFPWREWGLTEKSYFVQVTVGVAIAGVVILGPGLPLEFFAVALAWGFYQEVIYRGILQTALVRRVGTAAGILVANLLFTFGPLHFYHFFKTPAPAAMFAVIFMIGLFFAVLFHRSHNLWIAATFHGLGGAIILSLQGPAGKI